MVVKNFQTVAVCVAKFAGVRVTGMGSMKAAGKSQAPRSLPRLPLPGLYPVRTGPDANLWADNAAPAQAVERTGRSACGAGDFPTTRLARCARGTVLSKRSWSFISEHRESMSETSTQLVRG